MFDLRDSFETTDGSRPEAGGFTDALAKKHPLAAIKILDGGDAFDAMGKAPILAQAVATYIGDKVRIEGADESQAMRIRRDLVRQLGGNKMLLDRMAAAKPVRMLIVPEGASLVDAGFPAATARHAAGIFWDHPSWDEAQIGFRAEHLERSKTLVFHEFGHAIHYIALSKKERDVIYRVLRPSFGSRAAMDEVFAIYSERECVGEKFAAEQKRAPGVYGFTRRQWDENQLFTRFMRKLYFPFKPLAGHKMASAGASAWKKFSGG